MTFLRFQHIMVNNKRIGNAMNRKRAGLTAPSRGIESQRLVGAGGMSDAFRLGAAGEEPDG